ncbi:hypothetical protein [Actinophytocola sp.]|uniref:hypothetical protein n=1 Tax=Actinophytocola sp. TaxID=1872138 RepID=UPI002ED48317
MTKEEPVFDHVGMPMPDADAADDARPERVDVEGVAGAMPRRGPAPAIRRVLGALRRRKGA